MEFNKLATDPLGYLKREFGRELRLLITPDGIIANIGMALPYADIKRRMTADTTDTVNLLDREHVMLVDDHGQRKSLPINPIATALYWQRCGGPVEHTIVGPVYIVPDEDFA